MALLTTTARGEALTLNPQSGQSYTFAASDVGSIVSRSYPGGACAVMTDTLPAGLAATGLTTVINSDPCAYLMIGAGSSATLSGPGYASGGYYLILGPGQQGTIGVLAGNAFVVTAQPTAISIPVVTTFHTNNESDGVNDPFCGLAPSAVSWAHPCADPQYMYYLHQSRYVIQTGQVTDNIHYDIVGFVSNLDIEGPIPGQNRTIEFDFNNTTLTGTSGNDALFTGQYANITVKGTGTVGLTVNSTGNCFHAGPYSQLTVIGPPFGPQPVYIYGCGGDALYAGELGELGTNGQIHYKYSFGGSLEDAQFHGIYDGGQTAIFDGNVSFGTAVVLVRYGGLGGIDTYTLNGFTVTGQRYQVDTGGVLADTPASAGNPNYIPGSSAGSVAPGGCYQGINC